MPPRTLSHLNTSPPPNTAAVPATATTASHISPATTATATGSATAHHPVARPVPFAPTRQRLSTTQTSNTHISNSADHHHPNNVLHHGHFTSNAYPNHLHSNHHPSPESLPFTSSDPSKLRRSAMPHFGVSPSAKPRGNMRKSFILLTVFLSFTFLFATHFTGPAVISHHNDLLRYSHAGAHFRKSLSPEQLETYYKEREAALRAASAASVSAASASGRGQKAKDVIIAPDATSDYFKTCVMSPETSALHASLRRGPDAKEIEGRAKAKQPRDFEDVFSVIDRKRYFFDADRNSVQTVDYLGAGLDVDIDDAIKVSLAVAERDIDAKLGDINVPIAYTRTTRRDGWQAVINLGGVFNRTVEGKVKRTNVRRMVTVTRGYGRPCEVALVRPREVVRINVIVPYSNRPHRIAAFLKMFALYFASSNSHMVRVIASTTKEEREGVLAAGQRHAELDNSRFLVVTSNGDEFGNFSRAVAVREAVKKVPSDEIIFIADTDLAIGGNFLQNCRVNIVRGSQVWFPVMFSLYPYGRGLSSRDGMWRRSSYGMVCMYQSDFNKVGGFGPNEESAFTGWGSEDVFLYNRFRDNDKYAVLRTLEPGLQHQWHGKNCERNQHYENCMRTVYMTIGSQDEIAKLMVSAHVDISNLTKDALPV